MQIIKGEGESKLTFKVRDRRGCDNCGDIATKRLTFCWINGRSNPASSMYQQDDCTYCCDSHAFSCDKCELEVKRVCRPDGMSWTSTFTANDRFASMFLYWNEREPTKGEILKFIEENNAISTNE